MTATMIDIGTDVKWCPRHEDYAPVGLFSVRSDQPGLKSWCRPCIAEYCRLRRRGIRPLSHHPETGKHWGWVCLCPVAVLGELGSCWDCGCRIAGCMRRDLRDRLYAKWPPLRDQPIIDPGPEIPA